MTLDEKLCTHIAEESVMPTWRYCTSIRTERLNQTNESPVMSRSDHDLLLVITNTIKQHNQVRSPVDGSTHSNHICIVLNQPTWSELM